MLEMGQNEAARVEDSAMLASDQECKAAVLARGDLDMGAGVLGDRLASPQRFAFTESVRIVKFPFFVWHMENLEQRDSIIKRLNLRFFHLRTCTRAFTYSTFSLLANS